MSASSDFVIIGAGLAGARTAEALRAQGCTGRIRMVGDEERLPYLRPPLSKGYLTGAESASSLPVLPASWYADHDVELILGTPVTRLDRIRRRIVLADGTSLPFDKAVIATGSAPRRLVIPGADVDGVHCLRTIDDSDRIRAGLASADQVVLIGGGWIGLEVASAAHAAALDVSIIETADLPLERVLGQRMGRFFVDLHRDHGVHWHLGGRVERLESSSGRVAAVRLADGSAIDADLVVVGVGISPNTAIAEAAGLAVNNGIVVDEHLRTNDPDIYAVGDVANAYHPFLARRIRVGHWANARYQPAVAAAGMLGRPAVYDRLPFFYSDQYDLGLEYTGLAGPGDYDEVVIRGNLAARQFIAFWLANDRVLAGMNVNVWGVSDQIAEMIHGEHHVDRSRLLDPDIPLQAA